jgi:DNA-binding transcriptional ArsR family regulator
MVNSTPALDRVFHALADPTRRALLTRLSRGDATVGELAEPFATSLPAISKHLKVLEQAGLLSRDVRGREHHCRLVPGPLRTAGEWIGYYRRFWNERLDALEELFTGGSIPGRPRTGGRRARHRH